MAVLGCPGQRTAVEGTGGRGWLGARAAINDAQETINGAPARTVRQVAGTLIIREARVADSGKYLCQVNNTVGGESVETVLTVTGQCGGGAERYGGYGRSGPRSCGWLSLL